MSADKPEATNNILLAVLGETPQVITNTVWALSNQHKILAGDIHIITTTTCKDILLDDVRTGIQEALDEINTRCNCSWTFSQDNIVLIGHAEDLITQGDHILAADTILNEVRRWTSQDDVVLYASLAGGRKTMGVFLAQAMSWYARPLDTLSYLNVGTDMIECFYPPPRLENQVYFVFHDFVRLRDSLPQITFGSASNGSPPNYSTLVKRAQIVLNDRNNVLPKLCMRTSGTRYKLIVGDDDADISFEMDAMDAALWHFMVDYGNTFSSDPEDKDGGNLAFSLNDAIDDTSIESLTNRLLDKFDLYRNKESNSEGSIGQILTIFPDTRRQGVIEFSKREGLASLSRGADYRAPEWTSVDVLNARIETIDKIIGYSQRARHTDPPTGQTVHLSNENKTILLSSEPPLEELKAKLIAAIIPANRGTKRLTQIASRMSQLAAVFKEKGWGDASFAVKNISRRQKYCLKVDPKKFEPPPSIEE